MPGPPARACGDLLPGAQVRPRQGERLPPRRLHLQDDGAPRVPDPSRPGARPARRGMLQRGRHAHGVLAAAEPPRALPIPRAQQPRREVLRGRPVLHDHARVHGFVNLRQIRRKRKLRRHRIRAHGVVV